LPALFNTKGLSFEILNRLRQIFEKYLTFSGYSYKFGFEHFEDLRLKVGNYIKREGKPGKLIFIDIKYYTRLIYDDVMRYP
jgi:hypothetical protein